MKKIIIALLLCASFGYAQDFGTYKVVSFKIMPDNGAVVNNQWYKFKGDTKLYTKYYNRTPIGIKKAIEDVEEILYQNEIKFDTCVDNSFMSSLVNGINDYQMLNISIENESSEISKSWYIDRTNTLMLSLKADEYKILIYKQ